MSQYNPKQVQPLGCLNFIKTAIILFGLTVAVIAIGAVLLAKNITGLPKTLQPTLEAIAITALPTNAPEATATPLSVAENLNEANDQQLIDLRDKLIEEHDQLVKEVGDLNTEIERLQVSRQDNLNTIEKLSLEVTSLQTESTRLEGVIAQYESAIEGLKVSADESEIRASVSNPGMYNDTFAGYTAIYSREAGNLADTSLMQLHEGENLLAELNIPVTYCGVTFKFVQSTDQTWIGAEIESGELNYTYFGDRLDLIKVREIVSIAEDQIKLLEDVDLPQGAVPQSRHYLTLDVLHSELYCSADGSMITRNFRREAEVLRSNQWAIGNIRWLGQIEI